MIYFNFYHFFTLFSIYWLGDTKRRRHNVHDNKVWILLTTVRINMEQSGMWDMVSVLASGLSCPDLSTDQVSGSTSRLQSLIGWFDQIVHYMTFVWSQPLLILCHRSTNWTHVYQRVLTTAFCKFSIQLCSFCVMIFYSTCLS